MPTVGLKDVNGEEQVKCLKQCLANSYRVGSCTQDWPPNCFVCEDDLELRIVSAFAF